MIVVSLIGVLAVCALDLISKSIICKQVVASGGEMGFLPKLIKFIYTENTGMAWGLFKNGTLVLSIITLISIAIMLYFLIKYNKKMPAGVRIGLVMVIGGALGNLFDRVMIGYVRDFIAFDFMNFPIFNVADSFITVGGVLMLISAVFTKKGRRMLDEVMKSDETEKKSVKSKDTQTVAAFDKEDKE